MDTPAEIQRIVKNLGVEVRKPGLFPGGFAGTIPLEPITDPVLKELAEKPDWREYDDMWRMPEVFDPWRHMTAQVLSEPFEIQTARNTPAAKILAAQARWMWSSLSATNRTIVIQRLLDADWYGWRPMQCILGPSTWPGIGGAARQQMWIPHRIVDKSPHHFRWTAEPQRRLVFKGGLGRPARLYSPEQVRAGWMVPRTRSLDDPYGRGLAAHCWLMWRVATSVSKRFYSSVDREWNMVHLKLSKIGANKDLRDHLQQLKADLAVVTQMLASKNILIDSGQFETSFLDKLEFIDSGVKLLQHIKTCLQTLIEGQTLTSETRTAGPAGSSVVHQQVKSEYAKATIAATVEPAVSELFHNMFWLNHGEIDPQDLPGFVSWLRLRINTTTARALFDMHVPLRGRRLAQLLGAESVVDSLGAIDADPDEILVLKPQGASGSTTTEPASDGEAEGTP